MQLKILFSEQKNANLRNYVYIYYVHIHYVHIYDVRVCISEGLYVCRYNTHIHRYVRHTLRMTHIRDSSHNLAWSQLNSDLKSTNPTELMQQTL